MSNLKPANHQYKFSVIVSKDDSHFKFVFTKKAKDILSLMHSLVHSVNLVFYRWVLEMICRGFLAGEPRLMTTLR